ncbi:peptide ABC transporter substrate-binding protein [Virgibacillus halodenitrificans]|uniref:Peptide ABC transporter substrate-binding protein n=1 Tax=Virgibacillus halodenitrificans TaxID=1482 RepID=A0ABR7VMB7_VIRHA|nr:peptide ABC transporter substrate-binding protein [Virgibacillus halodenitrificans]MBD1223050.1 peptide ABC transporter substrate-binding protein [Virgibacillus halodenitrificans]
MQWNKGFLLFVLGLILFMTACGDTEDKQEKESSSSNKDEKVVKISAPGEIPGIDPVMADNDFSFNVINQINEGLYRLDKEGKPQLAIAAKEPEVSKDKKVYTFKLREDALWSDGSPVTAHDFEYAWKKVVDPKTGAAYGPQLEEIVLNATEILKGDKPVDDLGIEALDDHTLKVTLENGVPFFKELLTTATFFPQPQEYIEEQGDKYATDSDHALYNGPFVLDDWTGTGMSWTYKKNENYWDKEAVNVDRIEVNVVKDAETAVNLYQNGQLDRVNLTSDNVEHFQGEDEFHTFLTGSTSYIKMNQGKDGETTDLANLHIRKAMNMAINKEVIVEELLGNGSVVAHGNVPKGLAEDPVTGEDFREQNGDLVEYNVEKAKEHWQKGLEELGKEKLEFTLTSSDSDFAKSLSENLKYQLENSLSGLTINLRPLTPKASIAANVGQDYEMIITGWSGDYQDPLTYLNLFITNSPGNHTGYSDETYDKLVLGSKSELATKPKERWDALLKAEQLLIEESAVLIPLYQNGTAYLQNDKVKDFITYQVSADNYKWMDIEE